MSKRQIRLFWFRRDLRLEDNRGLIEALKGEIPVQPLFIFDKTILDQLEKPFDRRVDFIHQALEKLNSELQEYGSSLLTIYDTPQNAFKKLITENSVESVFTNSDYEPNAIKRDLQIATFLKEKNIPFITFKDQVVFEKNEILKSDGTPYTIFTPYSKIWKKQYAELKTTTSTDKKLFANFEKNKKHQLIALKELGFSKTDLIFTAPTLDAKIISNYDENRNIPGINSTTKLSIHLRFGTISIRKAAKFAIQHNEQWLNELIWREFFMQILFHFPHVVQQSFKKKYDAIQWRNNETEFKKWCDGETGYPIVDAGMRELNTSGFMHNRVRMVVASFLCKHLLIDWRWGEAYFANKLNDFELSANNGNWQWAAGSGCDAAPYFRIFNPAEQTKRFDPNATYIRKWVPEFDQLNYPLPLVEHKFARDRALKIYKKAVQNEV